MIIFIIRSDTTENKKVLIRDISMIRKLPELFVFGCTASNDKNNLVRTREGLSRTLGKWNNLKNRRLRKVDFPYFQILFSVLLFGALNVRTVSKIGQYI